MHKCVCGRSPLAPARPSLGEGGDAGCKNATEAPDDNGMHSHRKRNCLLVSVILYIYSLCYMPGSTAGPVAIRLRTNLTA